MQYLQWKNEWMLKASCNFCKITNTLFISFIKKNWQVLMRSASLTSPLVSLMHCSWVNSLHRPTSYHPRGQQRAPEQIWVPLNDLFKSPVSVWPPWSGDRELWVDCSLPPHSSLGLWWSELRMKGDCKGSLLQRGQLLTLFSFFFQSFFFFFSTIGPLRFRRVDREGHLAAGQCKYGLE